MLPPPLPQPTAEIAGGDGQGRRRGPGQPGRGLDYSSGTAFPGNWSQGANASNPLAAGGCKGADLIPRNGICRQSLWRYLDLVPETEKTSVFSRATGKLIFLALLCLEKSLPMGGAATQLTATSGLAWRQMATSSRALAA